MVKTYELPKQKNQGDSEPSAVRQGITRMGTGLGLTSKHDAARDSSKADPSSSRPKPSTRLRSATFGAWGFGAKKDESEEKNSAGEEEDDDRRIRFTIGGAGRRLTKEDFLKEIQSLDPKARCEVIEESDAPAAMKAMAKKDADRNSPGSSRLLGANATGAKTVQAASGKGAAHAVGAKMARERGVTIEGDSDEDSPHAPRRPGRTLAKVSSLTDDGQETAAERKRREKAMRGVEDSPSPPRRGRSHVEGSEAGRGRKLSPEFETPAEKRRREAALGISAQEDSEDDDSPRIPPPAAKPRGIRFAQSPARDPKKG